jgi:hypothetical protein
VVDDDHGQGAVSFNAGRGLVAHRSGGRGTESRNLPDRYGPNQAPDQRHIDRAIAYPGRGRVACRGPYMVSAVDFKRLGRGDIVAATGGLLLFLSLFLPWFNVSDVKENICGPGADCSAFETFSILDILLVMGAFAPWILVWIVIRGHELSWPPGEVTMIVGAVAGTLILYNGIVDQAGTNQEFVTLGVGWYLGLLASLMIIAGGAISQIRRGGVTRWPPGSF